MADASNPAPAPRPPHPGLLAAKIRRLAVGGQYSFGTHVFDRKELRDVTIDDAVEVLRLGEISGGIVAGDNPGEWKCKVVAKMDSGRKLGVVTVVMHEEHMFLVTVEWEDK